MNREPDSRNHPPAVTGDNAPAQRLPALPPVAHLQRPPARDQRQLVATVSLVVFMLIIISALYLIQTTTTTITARELQELNDQRLDLERQNERLAAEIAAWNSLPRMRTRAAEMGFREAQEDDIQYIIVDGYQYDRPRLTPTPTPTPASADVYYEETLGGWLRKQWDAIKDQFEEWQRGD